MLDSRSIVYIFIIYLLWNFSNNEIIFKNKEVKEFDKEIIQNHIFKNLDLTKTDDNSISIVDNKNNKNKFQNKTSSNIFYNFNNETEKIKKYFDFKRKLNEVKEEPLMFINKAAKNVTNLSCTDESSCNYRGKCFNETLCQCNPYYTTYYKKESMKFNFTQCNYKQISLKAVFSLSFFLGPLSFEHILMGNIFTGIVKIIFPMILILIGNSIFIIGKFKNNIILQITGKSFEFVGTLIIIVWWFIDWILILNGYYKDNKNVDLFVDFFWLNFI